MSPCKVGPAAPAILSYDRFQDRGRRQLYIVVGRRFLWITPPLPNRLHSSIPCEAPRRSTRNLWEFVRCLGPPILRTSVRQSLVSGQFPTERQSSKVRSRSRGTSITSAAQQRSCPLVRFDRRTMLTIPRAVGSCARFRLPHCRCSCADLPDEGTGH